MFIINGYVTKDCANYLTRLVAPYATVSPEDIWMPEGIIEPAEAELGKTDKFLSASLRKNLMSWWLKKYNNQTQTPNWDIASSCSIDGKPGLILVEAKAHYKEPDFKGKGIGNAENHIQIGRAINEANESLKDFCQSWNLTRDSHYQLCNRFAWAWKAADLGVPVILVYLGFLNCNEMKQPFKNAREWAECFKDYSKDIVPSSALEKRIKINNSFMIPLVRSMDLQFKMMK